MINRLLRIRREFGTLLFLRTLLLLVGMIGMAAMGFWWLSSVWPAVIVVIGMGLGLLLRHWIVEQFELFAWALPAALIIYSIVIFVGERLVGISRESQLLIITAVTVIVFNIQFWSLSDPMIIRQDD